MAHAFRHSHVRTSAGSRDAKRGTKRIRPTFDSLDDRVLLTTGPIGLGSAAQFAVLGLNNTNVMNLAANVKGNEGVSQGGHLTSAFSTVGGSVSEAAKGQYLGFASSVHGTVSVNSPLLSQANTDAQAASAQDAALAATQTFGSITKATTITGNGGLNVISIKGNLQDSLTLKGGANDVFVVNITGNIKLLGNASLKLAGGVTANHVLYNVTGSGGSVAILTTGAVNGTLLAPHDDMVLDGTFNGAVVGGGKSVGLMPGATVNPVPFSPPAPPALASLSGYVSKGGIGQFGVTVTLTGTDAHGNAVRLQTTTDGKGDYSFTGLQPGTYMILAPQVSGDTTTAFAGTVNGSTTADGKVDSAADITSIVLNGGDVGANFDFSEIYAGS